MAPATTRWLPLLLVVAAAGRPGRAESPARASLTHGKSRWDRLVRQLRRTRRSPRLAILLLRAKRDLETLPIAKEAAAVRRAIGGRPHPLVAFQYARLLASWDLLSGRRTPPRAWARLGIPRRLLVLGPFGAMTRGGLDEPVPPDEEEGIRASAVYESRDRKLRWEPLEVGPLGCFRPQSVLRPVGGVAYLGGAFALPSSGTYALRVGSEGAYEVHLDRVRLGRHDRPRPLHADQDTWTFSAERGWHVLRVKLAAGEGGWGLCLRVTDPRGRPVRGLRWSADPERVERTSAFLAGSRTRAAARQADSLLDWFRRSARRNPRDIGGRRDELAFAWAYRPGTVEPDEIRRAAWALARAHPSTATWLLAAETARETDKALALERAARLAVGPERGRILGLLAAWWLDRGRFHRALRLAGRAAEAGWTGPEARLLQVDLAVAAGLNVLAAAKAAELVRRYPSWPKGVLRWAQVLLDLDRPDRALAALAPMLASRPGDMSLVTLAWEAARRSGRERLGETAVRRFLSLRPESVTLRVALARSLAHRGRTAEAETLLRQGLALAPEDSNLLEALGRTHLEAGQVGRAREVLRRLLAASPQDEELRRRLAVLEERNPEPLAAKYGLRLEAAKALPSPEGADAVVLWDRIVYFMRPNGSLTRFRHRFVRVLTARGAREASTWSLAYQPDAQNLRILAARVHRSDGTVVPVAGQVEDRISDDSIRIYYDWNEFRIHFPRLRPGDVVEVEYVLSDVSAYQPFAGYLGVMEPLRGPLPRLRFDLVVDVPGTKRIFANRPKGVPVRHEVVRRRGRVAHWWRVGPVARFDQEPLSPGWSSVVPYLHVSTFASWEQVARWYWRLVAPQYRADEALKALAVRLARDAASVEEKVRAVYRFVTRKIRYVGLEFGIHTHKPYPAPEVLRRRFGDCKDKAMLMVMLLEQLGVEAFPVLVRTRFNGEVASYPASLAVFDHAIVYVPSLDRYLDGTAEDTASTDLPYPDQGAAALVLDRRGGRFLHTPVLPADRNLVDRRVHMTLDRHGAARVRERLLLRGQAAARWRRRYRRAPNRKRLVEESLGRVYPGAVLDALRIRGDQDPEQDLVLDLRYRIPRLLQGEPRRRSLPLGPIQGELLRRFAPLSRRKLPLELDYPFVSRERVEVQLAPGSRLVALPRTMHLADRTADAAFDQEARKLGRRRFVVSRSLRLGRLRIPPKGYGAFRHFCSRVDSALADEVLVDTSQSGSGGR